MDKAPEYSTQLRGLAKDFQFVREEERIGVAREIHDQLGQELTVLSLTLAKMRGDAEHAITLSGEVWRENLELLTSQVATLREATKRIAFELRPDVLEISGLKVAAEDLVADFSKRLGIRGVCRIGRPWQDPGTGLSLHLYRCLQELLSNVGQHAKASRVEVDLAMVDGGYELLVSDNGIGFPEGAVDAAPFGIDGQGLRGVYERAAITQGQVAIKTRPEVRGSEVRLRLPAPQGAAPAP